MLKIWPFVLLLLGCNSVVLEKAKLQRVHRIALVSLFASERIPEARGQGVLRKMTKEARTQIADDAMASFNTALDAKGWVVVPPAEIVQTAAYAHFKKPHTRTGKLSSAANAFETRYFSPNNVFAFWFETGAVTAAKGRPLIKNDREALAEVLKAVAADTAAVVRLQYCFRTYREELKERAAITAAASLQLLDGTGTVFHNYDRQGCGERERGESTGYAEMNEEDWLYDPMQRDAIRALFQQATDEEAQRLIGSLPVTPRKPR